MNMTDPIADMLTRIRNAIIARHTRVSIPASKMKLAIARVLKEEGYIKDIEVIKDNPQGTIRITLRYVDKKPVLTQLERVSKPGRRVYTRRKDIPLVRGGLGVAILSTPKGVMTGRKAYQLGLGGEVICHVW
ncbi:30S ribosomal protein S8 [Thermogemmatispora carboxidivorans]|uniref:30S ribosomal protein S8 n=1 Tax=Thermogemmatispora carboxidivorans TaxID=1382306 RepID=UPI0006996415|nr:30S ribosomal protein S8 [Thermogemmatispora carboxidivorans]